MPDKPPSNDDFYKGLNGDLFGSGASYEAGKLLRQQREAMSQPIFKPEHPAQKDSGYPSSLYVEVEKNVDSSRPRIRKEREPLTEEEKLRKAHKTTAIVFSAGLIYLAMTRLNGDAEIYAIIASIIAAPIAYKFFNRSFSRFGGIILGLLMLGFFGYVGYDIYSRIEASKNQQKQETPAEKTVQPKKLPVKK